MPYNPGVAVNFSPIFQGLAGGAADLASAMVAKKEKDDQDKDFSARSRATEAFIKTHAPDLGWNGDQVKAMLAQGLDETPRAHYLRLSDTVSQAVTGATLKDQRQKRQQEQQVADLKLNELKRSLSQDVTNRSALRNSMNPEMAGMAAALARPDYKFGDAVAPIDNPLAAYTGAGGEDPHTLATLAPLAQQMIKVNRPGPALVTLGKDANGKPVQGVYDGNNFQALKGDKAATESQLGKLISERDAHRAAGHGDAVAEYDRVIKSMGVKYDAFGNPMTGEPPVGRDPFETDGLPKPATKKERDALPPGSKYVGPDGQVYSVPGKVPVGPAAELTQQDRQALEWAQANPGDPRAAAILKRFSPGK